SDAGAARVVPWGDFSIGVKFSTLQRFADRDRTTAERDEQAAGLARDSRLLSSCRRNGGRTEGNRGSATGQAVLFSSRFTGPWAVAPRSIRLGAWFGCSFVPSSAAWRSSPRRS